MRSGLMGTLDFTLAAELAAHEPPEARGRGRDDVRLMVSQAANDVVAHTHFNELPDLVNAGDVLIVNTSATINAAFHAVLDRGSRRERIQLHLSTPLVAHRWVIELRRATGQGSLPLLDAVVGDRVHLPGGGVAVLSAPFDRATLMGTRLWQAELSLPTDVLAFGERHGFPIRYSYVPRAWPLAYYQTIFAIEPGSAEMASAGRPFTWQMVQRLTDKGVRIAPIVLHAGVASLESGEEPYPERFRVPRTTATMINRARAAGRRVIAVGTTAVRALESAASPWGLIEAAEGWTDLVVTPERGVRTVDGLLTGLHAPRASHLAMLQAIAGEDHLACAYDEALAQRYLWHEFGDLHLILRN